MNPLHPFDQGHPLRLARGVALAAALLALVACTRHGSRELQPGSYRATVELAGGKQVPFGLDVAQEESATVLYVINGEERVRLDDVQVVDGRLQARFPGYETTLTAEVEGGELTGTVSLVHAGGKLAQLPFAAELGPTWRFHPEPLPDNADFAGRWDVTFTDASGRRSPGVAVLEQRFEQVTGTMQLPDGDQRYLEGEARDETLQLSRFDGGAVVLYEAQLDASGNLSGSTWSDRGGQQRWVAKRNPDATIEAAALATRLRDPDAGFTFAFPDLAGQTVASTDPRFAGKVLLVTLAGSWCPNSHDQARLLVQLDEAYRERGLAIVSLMFEQHAQPAAAVAAIERFRAALGVEYTTLLAGGAGLAQASKALPQLEAVLAYPTTILIDRAGQVRKIHTGFAGPATGTQHDLLAHEWATEIEALLQ
jgi:thiol-disulfide isomerase/thioredoxin